MNHKLVTKYVTEEGVVGEITDSIIGDGVLAFSGTLAPSANVEIDLAFPYLKVKSLFISASQATSFVMNGSNTLAIPAGGCYAYSVNGVAAFKLTADVASISATNGSSTTASNVVIRALLDVTP